MNHLALDEVEIANRPGALNSVRKPLSAALGTTAFAMVYFELEPGEGFAPALHTHHDVRRGVLRSGGDGDLRGWEGPRTNRGT